MIEFLLILAAPLIGGLLYGLERKMRARMQNRQGPPLLQPFYDMYKLLGKQTFIIHPYHSILGVAHFVALWIVVAFVIMGYNLLYIVFLHLFSSLLLVLAGYSVRSIYSHVGANRELVSMLGYEPILILLSVAFYLLYGSYDINVIRENPPPLWSLLPLFLSFLLVMLIKLKKSPFDAAHGHQEIVGGVEVEFSGVFFEFLYMARWLEYIFIYLLLLLFGGDSFVVQALLAGFVFVFVNLIDNATARVRMKHLLQIALAVGLSLGLINILGLAYV